MFSILGFTKEDTLKLQKSFKSHISGWGRKKSHFLNLPHPNQLSLYNEQMLGRCRASKWGRIFIMFSVKSIRTKGSNYYEHMFLWIALVEPSRFLSIQGKLSQSKRSNLVSMMKERETTIICIPFYLKLYSTHECNGKTEFFIWNFDDKPVAMLWEKDWEEKSTHMEGWIVLSLLVNR